VPDGDHPSARVLSLRHIVGQACSEVGTKNSYKIQIESLKVYDDGYINHGPNSHPSGNYSIELVIKKL
jgi:hypothetical protein